LRGAAHHSPALFAPTNHEERWGDHSCALDSVMLDGESAMRLTLFPDSEERRITVDVCAMRATRGLGTSA
jgi:hypothetical protein